MIRGTDTIFRFKIPCKPDELNWATIKFWQPNNNGTTERPLPIIKTKEDRFPSDENLLIVRLTAEETARFSDRLKAYVQMRGCCGGVFGSKKTIIPIYSMDDDIIANDDDYVILDGGIVDANTITYTILDGNIIV